jgi:hypothetical protein
VGPVTCYACEGVRLVLHHSTWWSDISGETPFAPLAQMRLA